MISARWPISTKKIVISSLGNCLVTFAIATVVISVSQSQDFSSMTKAERDAYVESIRTASAADHKKLMALLGITSLRPGANGNDPNAPNAANYDEAKANPYPDLPMH